MDGAGQALIHFLTKSANRLFHNAQKEAIWQKKFLKLVHRGKSAKMEKKPFYCQIAILALLPLCINFKIFFCQMASFWALWKSLLALFVKKCIMARLSPSMYLSRHKMAVSEQGRWWKKFFFAWNVFIWVQTLKKMQSQVCSILLGLLRSTSHMCFQYPFPMILHDIIKMGKDNWVVFILIAHHILYYSS